MSKKLNIDSQFTVKEDKILNYIIAIVLFGFSLFGIIQLAVHGFAKGNSIFVFIAAAIFPAIMCLVQANSKRVYIRINKTGIYEYEKLVTSWHCFLKGYIHQKMIVERISDYFELVIEYYKNDPTVGYRRRIRLTNTQNKSEEDIMAAIHFFVTACGQNE